MKIGIIGIGNMGSSIAKGLLGKNELFLSNRGSNLDFFKDKDVSIMENRKIVENSDYVILAVKPNYYKEVIYEIKDLLENKVFISIAAGFTLEKLENLLGSDKKIVMTMPNAPASVGEGMSILCPNSIVSDDEFSNVLEIFSSFGKAIKIDENQFDAASIVNGCLPAFVDLFMESLSDGAVLCGLKRDTSYKLILQTIIGSAKLMEESGDHPGLLKDKVTSPKGTTIEGVKALEENNFRAGLIKAVEASFNKAKNM
ncbi:pyrroline-5-carboxylate reductase [Anaerococcus sp. HMSC075B03]|uniref:pyrroline-5-carboxylate reductase n=1 Tax=Anaerococcus sp. HMSC075B03 TaxID=1739537 RepID=UPI0008A5584F|nr:pyrroline-5-carboxylate reductase [Anaerococcus sp. HMSC075B03]OFO43317.1 pyrroline-5-carboxylate reductase [Anaerococcus sp. HMSC075B03]